jgi:hypothetical protein
MKKISQKPLLKSGKGHRFASGLVFAGIMASGIACGKDDKVENDSSEYTSKAYIIQLSTAPEPVLPQNFDNLSRFNFYGICWNGTAGDNLKFAKQMGYSFQTIWLPAGRCRVHSPLNLTGNNKK